MQIFGEQQRRRPYNNGQRHMVIADLIIRPIHYTTELISMGILFKNSGKLPLKNGGGSAALFCNLCYNKDAR